MIDRAEIEFTLKVAEAGARCEAPAKVMAELCRVYLAWLDAPEAEVTREDWLENFQQISASMIGKRVKLLEVPDVGG